MLGVPFTFGRGSVSSHTRVSDPAARRRKPAVKPSARWVEQVEPRLLFAQLWISDAVVTEGHTGDTNAVFTVTLFQPGDQPVTVNYATANSSATTPEDYRVTSGTLTFNPGGATSQQITVPVIGDTLQENNELFLVQLSSAANATVVGGEGRGYIADDDQSYLTIHNIYVAEGSGAAPTNAVLTVTRSGSTAGTTTVNYATSPSNATSPADFATGSGTLTFAPGVTTQQITVPVVADNLDEVNETFSVSLNSPVNSTVTAGTGTVTIVDDDASSLTISGIAVQEGTGGTSNAVVTVTRHGALGGQATVAFATSNSTAVAVEDFTQTTGTLTFAPGDATEQITIPIVTDAVQETDQRFFVNLSNAQNATIAETSAEIYLIDDDASSFVIEGSAVTEGESGATPLTFNVRRYGSLAGAARVNYATSNSNATAPGDYTQTTGFLDFAPGEAVKTISVPVVGDNAQEIAEQFFVTISAATNGTIVENQAAGMIFDDDESFFTIANITNAQPEGDAGATSLARFIVTRHGSLDGAASVNFGTINGSATTPSDYTVSNGTLSFAVGEASKEVTATILGDATAESNEFFGVQLTAPQNAAIAETIAYTWIVNDDGPVTTSYFFPRDAIVSEGDTGTVTMTFAVQRYGAVGAAASVNYTVNNGTAVQNQDFTATAGTLSFAAGDTEESFTVTVLADGLDESTETFSVSFSGAVGGQVADGSVQGMIVDDDEINLYVNDVSTQEGDDPTRDVRFTVTRFGETSGTTTVNWGATPSSATTPADFQAGSGTVTFAPGDSSEEIVVRVVGDAIQENPEQYFISLTAPVNGTVIGSTGQGYIIDDDEALIYVNDVSVTEGTGATATNATFTITRFGSTDGTTTVQYNAINSSTTAGDYTPTTGTVTFAPGETSKQVTVPVTADTLQEASEVFLLDIAVTQNGTVVGGRGSGRIVDDDTSFVGVTGLTMTEGNTGANEAVYTVTRFGSTAGTSSVEFRTNNSSASSPGDFTAVSTTVSFAPGDTTETVTVPIITDTAQELNEQFSVSLLSPQNTTVLAGTPVTYIIDDDESLLYATSAAIVEGNAGNQDLVLTVHRLGSLLGTTTVNFNAAASSATTPADFLASAGTLTFAPGVASQTVTVPIVGDLALENIEEAFNLNLSAAQSGTIVNATAQGTIIDNDPAPTVTRVYLSSTQWLGDGPGTTFKEYLQAQNLGSVDYGFAIPGGPDQLRAWPWTNLNQVSIQFSQDVDVQKEDLAVRGTNLPTYAFLADASGFAYNAANRTATWTFAAPLARDRIILDLDSSAATGVRNAGNTLLDGDWTNGNDSYPSGNGSPGGDLLFRLNVLPGDVDGNGTVLANDYSSVKARFFKNTTSPVTGTNDYGPYFDIDGNGTILANDYSGVKARFFQALPAAQPSGAALFGERLIGPGSRDLLA